jgi:hypothetical protein
VAASGARFMLDIALRAPAYICGFSCTRRWCHSNGMSGSKVMNESSSSKGGLLGAASSLALLWVSTGADWMLLIWCWAHALRLPSRTVVVFVVNGIQHWRSLVTPELITPEVPAEAIEIHPQRSGMRIAACACLPTTTASPNDSNTA